MAAAVRLFSQQGYARTTTKEIAAEAGISEGTIYTYFGSKQDLLFAFIEATAVDTLKPLLGEKGASREEVLRALLQDRLALAGRVGPLMKVVIGEALFDPELARAVAEKVAGPLLGLMEEFVARGSQEGQFREVSPQVVAQAIGGIFLSFAIIWPTLFPTRTTNQGISEKAGEIAELLLYGLTAHPAPGRTKKETTR
jgi:AcrR family transcriptional regulator